MGLSKCPLRRTDQILHKLKSWAGLIRRDVLALYLAGRDPRVPWYAKVLALATAAYALSPIDLIPDFIPVIGYLDDLIIVPLGILCVVKMIPADIMADLRAQAARRISQARPVSVAGAVFVIFLWLVAALGIAYAVLA